MDRTNGKGTLGTFAGVFTPSILTILGIILFLRLGYVVGNGGLGNTLAIIGVATAVSILTSISLAAISTNIDVKAGGDYYLISRTLGVEFGGAIGIVLFLAQSVSISFYAIGFGEAISDIVGWEAARAPQFIAAIAVAGLFLLAWLGADVASRFQFVVMALLVGALASIYVGTVGEFDGSILADSWAGPKTALGFWALFAIFFPAVTGFTQGVSMSGDLKNPGKSLPIGTFAAVGISTVVYLSITVLLAGSISLETLAVETGAMRGVAWIPLLIDAGVIAATLSSAMASFLGAPRILQSLASDRVFSVLNPFAKGYGPSANPRRAVLLSLGLALATIALGSLNVIAPVVSMFFLISYGLINYATYYEARAASPSFRPRFRFFDKRLSLLGAIACLGAMLAISPTAGVAAVIVIFGIYQYLRGTSRPERWADASHAHYFSRAVESIRALSGEQEHARNWRPQVLAFSADADRRERLMRFAGWLEGGSGLAAVVQVLSGEGAIMRRHRQEVQRELEKQVESLDLDVFPLAVLAPDAMEALPVIVQSFGVGPLKANTVLFGWSELTGSDPHRSFGRAVANVIRFGSNVVCATTDQARWTISEARQDRRIDVWWRDDDASRLALLAAYLFTRTPDWADSKIRLLASATNADEQAEIESQLADVLEEARIPATLRAVRGAFATAVAGESADAALVLLPAKVRQNELITLFDQPVDALIARLPLAAAVMAAAPVELNAGPETGRHGLLAEAEERAETAVERLRTLEVQMAQAEAELDSLRTNGTDQSGPDAAGFEEAEARATSVARRLLKAQGVAELARAEVAKLIGAE